MVKSKSKQIYSSIILLGLIAVTLILANPTVVIKLYKSLYVKYVRIAKSDFENRFTDAQLQDAITHAAAQPWVQDQIAADLMPYQNGISRAQLNAWFKQLQDDSKNKLAKFTIRNGKVSVVATPEVTTSRAYKTVYSVVSILANKKHIPDCEFIVAMNDYLAYVPENHTTPAAILSFAKHTQLPVEQNTILIPDWMNVRYWDVLRSRIDLANRLFPWERKKDLIHWRGGRADSMQHRSRLLSLTKDLEFLDVGMTEGANAAAYMDPEFSVQYKYQIALDGARCTWERMVWQMYSNTVLIKPNSPQAQWFHRGLIPYVNYVPITDVTESEISAAYNWLQNNDDSAKLIMRNANKFARENFKTQDFFAYYAVLLNEYAKLMKA
jgi:hypothetical protein